MATWKHVSAAQ